MIGSVVASGLLNTAGNIWSNKMNKDNMQYSYGIWNRMQDRLEGRQDYLMQNAKSIEANSMRQAGFSPLWSEGGSAQSPPSTSMPSSPQLQGSIFGNITPDMLVNLDKIKAEKDYVEEQTRGEKIKNDNAGKYWELTLDEMQTRLTEAKGKLDTNIETAKVLLQNAKADGTIKEKEANNIEQSTNKIIEEIKGIQIDNKYKDKLNEENINKLKNEVSKLASEGKYEAVKAKLAESGIIVGADWMTQLAAIAQQGTGSQIMSNLMNMFTDVFKSFGEGIGDVLTGIADGIGSATGDISEKVGKQIKQKITHTGHSIWRGLGRKLIGSTSW